LSASEIVPAEKKGDVMLIAGRSWPVRFYAARERLAARSRQQGFDQVMEAAAYSWFNRFAALRYMELHDYLNHGFRVLSNPAGGLPEILQHVQDVELQGLNKDEIRHLQLAGNKDGEIYRQVLLAQCNALHRAMPFLFEKLDDETELLLPDNLLLTDSVVANLVNSIDEDDWQQVEIIGWLYQFYISEKKDDVIGKVVKSEDIPAATQLFTPNWIVKYLVQNSVGRLWLQANPQSDLASKMEYYIQPAEQTPEVNAQLDALIKTRIAEDGDVLKPESITVLDPACGSGHILVEAYDLLKEIYLERGNRLRDIPKLILQNNLFGLDIDDRAAQLAGFALLMKARADDRRLFEDTPSLHVMALQDSHDLDDEKLANAVFDAAIAAEGGDALPTGQLFGGGQLATEHSSGLKPADIRELIQFFAYGKTFGSLLIVPPALVEKLPMLDALLRQVIASGDDLSKSYALEIQRDYLKPAQLLSAKYDSVIANPPYMGGKGMNAVVKDFAKSKFPDSKSDLFAMFMERGFWWCNPSGFNSMVTMQSWMFLSSYESMREKLLADRTLSNMVHMGNGVMGIAFGTAATVMFNGHVSDYAGSFSYCENDDIGENEKPKEFPVNNERLKTGKPDDFKKVPGSPVAYWLTRNALLNFQICSSLAAISEAKSGMSSCNSALFLRAWHEISSAKLKFDAISHQDAEKSGMRWFPYNKGGGGRRWYGYNETVINWLDGGAAIKEFVVSNPNDPDTTHWSRRLFNLEFFFKKGVTWSAVSSGGFAVRAISQAGVIPGTGSKTLYDLDDQGGVEVTTAVLNSVVARHYLSALSPTMNYEAGDVGKLPIAQLNPLEREAVIISAKRAIAIAKDDWNEMETSYGFLGIKSSWLPSNSLLDAWEKWATLCQSRREELGRIEAEIDRLLISAYNLKLELSEKNGKGHVNLAEGNREIDSQRLISYAIGCMMGRFSLDEPGLIYAHAGNVGFDANRYKTFPADADGIVPITDELWFEDDATNRVQEFLKAVWGEETLDENMAWLSESLGVKGDETPEETIRRYISGSFYKDHLQTYKKRPIYWQFSSGKQGAFQALVYLHRYNEGTLSRMRAEYVVPLTGKMQARIALLEQDRDAATATTTRNKISKQIESLRKKHLELLSFDEKLRHYADMRIKLDLDDGVKVNYGKFGDLLDSVKAITGGSED
jgi:hypothetical protein